MKKIIKNAFLLFLPVILGSVVGFIISGSIDYTSLNRPPLAPPKIFFPIAWTIIYILMGISYFILKRHDKVDDNMRLIYYVQLGINLLWSIIFFNLKWRFISILWIVVLDNFLTHYFDILIFFGFSFLLIGFQITNNLDDHLHWYSSFLKDHI